MAPESLQAPIAALQLPAASSDGPHICHHLQPTGLFIFVFVFTITKIKPVSAAKASSDRVLEGQLPCTALEPLLRSFNHPRMFCDWAIDVMAERTVAAKYWYFCIP